MNGPTFEFPILVQAEAQDHALVTKSHDMLEACCCLMQGIVIAEHTSAWV